ncbi:MAG TPA: DUF2892 domain-containing protein [Bacteroidales bacterium]|nr:DUF2892 domain-containing protein [Bacteroidales bacterium]
MTYNVGTVDRAIRVTLAVLIGILVYTRTVTGTPGMIISVIAIFLIFTSIRGFCPLYRLLRINTGKTKKRG